MLVVQQWLMAQPGSDGFIDVGDREPVQLDHLAERPAGVLGGLQKTMNGRAAVLLLRLGVVERAVLAGLRGDTLVVGIDVRGGDCDIPMYVP